MAGRGTDSAIWMRKENPPDRALRNAWMVDSEVGRDLWE